MDPLVLGDPWSRPPLPPTRSCHTGQRYANSHMKRDEVVKSVSKCWSPAVSSCFCPSKCVLWAGRFSEADKEAEHVMKQPANMMECVSDTIQLVGPPHSKWNGACNLWLVWCVDAWQLGGVASFLSQVFLLPLLPHQDPWFPWFPLHAEECGFSVR